MTGSEEERMKFQRIQPASNYWKMLDQSCNLHFSDAVRGPMSRQTIGCGTWPPPVARLKEA
jgi:hypothetical protein